MPLKNPGNECKIVSIKYLKNKIVILFNNEEKLELSKETFTDFHLYINKIVSQDELRIIREREEKQKLLNYAIKILLKKSYSEKEIIHRFIKKGGKKDDIDYVINYLHQYNLLNDTLFIKDRLDYDNYMNYGKNRIINDLLSKGCSMDDIMQIDFNYDNELQKALHHLPSLEKKYYKYSYNAKKIHIAQSLFNLGFDRNVINIAIENMKHINEDDEIENAKNDYSKALRMYKNKYQGKNLTQKIMNYLVNKGYSYNIINKIVKE